MMKFTLACSREDPPCPQGRNVSCQEGEKNYVLGRLTRVGGGGVNFQFPPLGRYMDVFWNDPFNGIVYNIVYLIDLSATNLWVDESWSTEDLR
jgi:hypothetical protein